MNKDKQMCLTIFFRHVGILALGLWYDDDDDEDEDEDDDDDDDDFGMIQIVSEVCAACI